MFIIIWGFRARAKALAIVQLACRNGHVSAHRIVKVTRWFTLFFIPLIPVSKKYRSVCAACGLQLQIPKDAAEDMIARATGAPVPARVDPVSPPVALRGQDWGASAGQDWGAVPAQPPLGGPPAGWYPDPTGSPGLRWWDGNQWTEAVQPA